MVLLLTLLLAAIVAWYLASPFFSDEVVEMEPAGSAETRATREKRERLEQMLNDLELEHSLEELSPEEYRAAKERLQKQLEKLPIHPESESVEKGHV
jgi:hypothetical protein